MKTAGWSRQILVSGLVSYLFCEEALPHGAKSGRVRTVRCTIAPAVSRKKCSVNSRGKKRGNSKLGNDSTFVGWEVFCTLSVQSRGRIGSLACGRYFW